MHDIVIPNGNEEDFCSMAKKTGYSGLIFAYDNVKKIPKEFPKRMACHVLLLNSNSKDKNNMSAIISSVQDRQLMESRNPPGMLIGPELNQASDKIHYRSSGLNQIICRIATQKNIFITPFLSKVYSGNHFHKATAIGRISQNIILCRKYKCRMIIASFAENPFAMRNPQDLAAFMVDSGMTIEEAKNSLIKQYPLH